MPTGPSSPEAAAILEQAKAAAARGFIPLTKHAKERMRERGVQAEDIRLAIGGATRVRPTDNEAWRLSGGNDADGEALDVVIGIDPIRVVTVM